MIDTEFVRTVRGGAFHLWSENFVTEKGQVACRPNYLRLAEWDRLDVARYTTERPVTAHLLFNYEHPNESICRKCIAQVSYSLDYSSPEAITEFATLTGLDPMSCFYDVSPDPTINQLERFAALNDLTFDAAWMRWLDVRSKKRGAL